VTRPSLESLLHAELSCPAPPEATALATQLAQQGGSHTVAVLYYGSTLRSGQLDGVLDFYVLLDSVWHWPGSWFTRLANCWLPPNVGYLEFRAASQTLRAKYAVMSLRQFHRRMRRSTLDTTLWARFSQPCRCLWYRSTVDIKLLTAALATGTETACHWAAVLGPPQASALDYWRALFANTYATELRVERADRAHDLVGQDAERYARTLPLAWSAAQRPYIQQADGQLVPERNAQELRRARRQWGLRQRLGKPLNILRILKASLTFDGGMDYIVWKIERHSGVKINVAPWQRRFPLLAAPGLYWQLRRRGVLR
jgi:hypothetical protein